MKLYLVRHGFAFHNWGAQKYGEKVYYDKSYEDSHLMDLGKEQSNNLLPILNEINFTDIYCSPLRRCIETCDNAIKTNLNILLDDRLMEPQGEHICNKRKNRNELEKFLLDMSNKYILYNIEGNYSFDKEMSKDIDERIISFLFYLKSKYKKEDNILIITHHDWLFIMFKLTTGQLFNFRNAELKMVELN